MFCCPSPPIVFAAPAKRIIDARRPPEILELVENPYHVFRQCGLRHLPHNDPAKPKLASLLVPMRFLRVAFGRLLTEGIEQIVS